MKTKVFSGIMSPCASGKSTVPPHVVHIVTPKGDGYRRARRIKVALAKALSEKGVAIVEESALQSHTPDLVIALGGDGTMMKAVARFSVLGVPTLGVNAGDVGFLASAEGADWRMVADRILEGAYRVERRFALMFRHADRTFGPFTNEVALRHSLSIATYRVEVDQEVLFEELPADGILVATATGSTAYNVSAGGPILLPCSSNVVISALNPTILNVRPVVAEELAHGGSIALTLVKSKRNESVQLTGDATVFGSQDGFADEGLPVGDSVVVAQHPAPLLFATFGLSNFVKALRTKKGFAR